MELIKEDAFRKQLKKGLFGGYLFFGDEDYMKAFSVKSAKDAVCPDPSFALFNDMKIDVIDYSAAALADALMPLPMMSEQKLITVNGLNVGAMRQKELDELCDALELLGEYDYNVLIISVPAGQIDVGNYPKNPSALYKRLSQYLTFVQFDTVSGSRLISWVGKHFSANGVNASPEVCSFLIDYTGRSMYTLAGETEKLSYYVLENGRDTVTRDDVLKVSVAEIATDAYTLANAIMDGRGEDALNALSVMKFRRVDPIMLMSEVTTTICDLISIKALVDKGCQVGEIRSILKLKSEYRTKLYARTAANKSMQRLKEAVRLCAEADAALKGQFSQSYLPIERLICSL